MVMGGTRTLSLAVLLAVAIAFGPLVRDQESGWSDLTLVNRVAPSHPGPSASEPPPLSSLPVTPSFARLPIFPPRPPAHRALLHPFPHLAAATGFPSQTARASEDDEIAVLDPVDEPVRSPAPGGVAISNCAALTHPARGGARSRAGPCRRAHSLPAVLRMPSHHGFAGCTEELVSPPSDL